MSKPADFTQDFIRRMGQGLNQYLIRDHGSPRFGQHGTDLSTDQLEMIISEVTGIMSKSVGVEITRSQFEDEHGRMRPEGYSLVLQCIDELATYLFEKTRQAGSNYVH